MTNCSLQLACAHLLVVLSMKSLLSQKKIQGLTKPLLQQSLLIPKLISQKKRPNENGFKSAIITDTPEKENILSRRKKLPKNVQKRTVSSSSDSDISVHLASDNSASDHESIIEGISEIPGSLAQIGHQLNVEDFAVINVFSAEGRHKNSIGKIFVGSDEDCDHEVNFMRRSKKIRDGFQFPEEVDATSIKLNDIVEMLPKPSSVTATKRLCGVLKFGAHLAPYGL